MARFMGALGALTALILGVQSAEAQTQRSVNCGEIYTVVRGDTLRKIAVRVYRSDNYRAIYRANTKILPTEHLLEVGQQLFIPCLDAQGNPLPGQAAQTTSRLAIAAPQSAPAEIDARAAGTAGNSRTLHQRRIKFLTGGDYAPFTDEDLPEGGLFTDLLKRAMGHADKNRNYRITFINDWGPHLSVLLPEGAFDLGFPWFKPDCSKIDRLSEAMSARCTDFDFSDPFYEVGIGFYVRKGDPAEKALGYSELFGRTLCRPRGYFTFDLEQEDLRAPNVEVVVPDTPGDCFEMLAAGEVDVVSLNVLISEAEIAEQGLAGQVAEIFALATVQTLHVLAAKQNPFGESYLNLINRGLKDVRESGEWFTVVSRHLSEHGRATN